MFGPQDSMTVEQAMVMIYRLFGNPTADLSILNNYMYGSQVSTWAKDAVSWAIGNEIYCPDEVTAPQASISFEALSYCLGQIVVAS